MTPITLIIGPQKPVFCSENLPGLPGSRDDADELVDGPRSASRRLGARRPPPFFRGGNNGKQAGGGHSTSRSAGVWPIRGCPATPVQKPPVDRRAIRGDGATEVQRRRRSREGAGNE